MIPGLAWRERPARADEALEPHVLVAIRDLRARDAVTSQLLEAGFEVTTMSTFGIVETLLSGWGKFDMMVTAQSFGEMGLFGLPQLARSVEPDLPILVLEFETACGAGVLEAVQDMVSRWPLRERVARRVH